MGKENLILSMVEILNFIVQSLKTVGISKILCFSYSVVLQRRWYFWVFSLLGRFFHFGEGPNGSVSFVVNLPLK